jgi:hypothetical protein
VNDQNEEEQEGTWLVNPWSSTKQPYRFRAMKEPMNYIQTDDVFEMASDCKVITSLEGLGQIALKSKDEEEEEEEEECRT